MSSPVEPGMLAYFKTGSPGASALAALIGTRIFGQVPQQAAYPYVAYSYLGQEARRTLSGHAGLERARFQFLSVATTHASMRAVSTAVYDVIGKNGFVGTWNGIRIQRAFWDDQSGDEEIPAFLSDDPGISAEPQILVVWWDRA